MLQDHWWSHFKFVNKGLVWMYLSYDAKHILNIFLEIPSAGDSISKLRLPQEHTESNWAINFIFVNGSACVVVMDTVTNSSSGLEDIWQCKVTENSWCRCCRGLIDRRAPNVSVFELKEVAEFQLQSHFISHRQLHCEQNQRVEQRFNGVLTDSQKSAELTGLV